MTSYTPGYPDLDAIKRLDPLSAGQRWGILHQDVSNRQPGRWAFDWEQRYAGLTFKGETFFNHKTGAGGSVIDMVIAYHNGGEIVQGTTAFKHALHWIAAREGLWLSFGRQRKRAQDLGAQSHGHKAGQIAKALESGGGYEAQLEEAHKLLDAVGVSRSAWSACIQAAGKAAALCWIPACPWMGQRVMRKPDPKRPGRQTWGGWTKATILEHWGGADAGQIHSFDLDEGPLVALVLRAVRDLVKLGAPPAAVVLSTPLDDARAKVHLYWRALDRAPDEESYLRRQELLAQILREVVASWEDVGPEERGRFSVDPVSYQITRLMRLPGFSKASAQIAGVVLEASGARVDLVTLFEERPVTLEVCWEEQGRDLKRVWEFGGRVTTLAERLSRGDVVAQRATLADCVWPLSLAKDVVTSAYGVRIRYRDLGGRVRYQTVSASSWIDRGAAVKEAGRLADAGIQIHPRQGGAFVEAIGEWARRAQEPQVDQVVGACGWHELEPGQWAWVGGPDHIYGAQWIWGRRGSVRGQIAGTVESWLAEVGPLVVTPGLRLALGVALAGSLVQRLALHPFLVHFAGASSSGKSRAGRLAASVWGPPATILTWQTTEAALAARLEEWSGAAVVLDEVQLMPAWQVARFIHTFSSGVERARLRRDATLRAQRSWALCALSTGEITLQTHLGDNAQGGHAVRGVDVQIHRGDLTLDALHADALAMRCEAHYGALGVAWAQRLVAMDEEGWTQLRARLDEVAALMDPGLDAELTRIVRQVALVVVALELAARWGLVPEELKEDDGGWCPTACGAAVDAGRWAIERIMQGRGVATSPEARAWTALQRLYASQPHRFPPEGEYRRGRDVVGVSETRSVSGEATGSALSLSSMLRIEEVIGQVTPTGLLEWAYAQGLAECPTDSSSGLSRVAGHQGRWHRLFLERDPPT